jgi:rhodanese-related sulfurtransferase
MKKETSMVETVNVQTLKQWLDSKNAVIVDVREPDEYAAGHIPGAVLVPLGTVDVSKLPELQGRNLVMQCKGGGRSSRACAKISAENPALTPYNLEGGITAWMQAGYEVKK